MIGFDESRPYDPIETENPSGPSLKSKLAAILRFAFEDQQDLVRLRKVVVEVGTDRLIEPDPTGKRSLRGGEGPFCVLENLRAALRIDRASTNLVEGRVTTQEALQHGTRAAGLSAPDSSNRLQEETVATAVL